MNYTQTLEYLFAKLPMFTKLGAAAIKKDLHNTLQLCAALGNPQDKFKSIHIGGTNGKGSVSHMLAAAFQEAGYKTGLYTSPHLKDFRERIRINGVPVPEDFVVDFVRDQQNLIEELSPSFFELTVAMAFSYFQKQRVDIAIIEVGLGGRLDSTNIIKPELSIITNISFDHTDLLGPTLKDIAREKAGIIKPNIPAIIGESNKEVDDIFLEKAIATKSTMMFADRHLQIKNIRYEQEFLKLDVYEDNDRSWKDLALDLTGNYQIKNVTTVLLAIRVLEKLGYHLTPKNIYHALASVKRLTGLQGRWQTLSEHPLVICDTAHNPAGIREVVKNILNVPYENLHMVIGMVKDKDVNSVLELLPKQAQYYFTQPQLERALPASKLAEYAANHELKGSIFDDPNQALQSARNNALEMDLVFVGGSTFVVAEIL